MAFSHAATTADVLADIDRVARLDRRAIAQALTDRAHVVATALLGPPSMGTRRTLRWGRRGSLVLELSSPKRGIWFDHERGEGGDLIDLICREHNVGFTAALEIAAQILGNELPWVRTPRPNAQSRTEKDTTVRQSIAHRLWLEAKPLIGTLGERYLVDHRGLEISCLTLDHALRWHRGKRAVIALMTDAATGLPVGVHRTFLDPDGRKLGRKMLGRQGVIRLSANDEVSSALGIAEGIEDALAVMVSGWRPVWVATSAGAIARLPVLPGVQALTIFADADIAGRKAADTCAARWQSEGREVRISIPAQGPYHG